MDVTERFWIKVDKSGECWLWTGGCFTNGYGSFRLDSRKVMSTHQRTRVCTEMAAATVASATVKSIG